MISTPHENGWAPELKSKVLFLPSAATTFELCLFIYGKFKFGARLANSKEDKYYESLKWSSLGYKNLLCSVLWNT